MRSAPYVTAVAAVGLFVACSSSSAQRGQFRATGNTDPDHRAKPWQKGAVVVTFDTTPARMSFDFPCYVKMVTENGIQYINGATETYIDGFAEGQSYEVWNDRDNVYSRFWIESQNDARIVVRHRNALVRDGKIAHANQRKVSPYGPGEWTDEWFIIHPDGTHIRRIKLYTPNALRSTTCMHGLGIEKFLNKSGGLPEYSFHEVEGMYLMGGRPGVLVEDELDKKAITLVQMDGSHRDISFDPYPVGDFGTPAGIQHRQMWAAYGEFRHANIHVINTKSKWRPFRICRPNRKVRRGFGGNNLLITPYRPVHKLTNLVPCFPPNATRQKGYYIAGLGQVTCSEHWEVTKDWFTEVWLNGFTTSKEPAKEVAALARSWQMAPKLVLLSKTEVVAYGHDIGSRAYLLDYKSVQQPQAVQFRLLAGEESPVVNPTFLINNWGGKNAELEIDGEEAKRGDSFRMGHYKTLDIDDGREWKDVLIVWAEVSATKPVEFRIRPEGYGAPGGAAALLGARKLLAEKQYAKAAAALRRLTVTQRGTDVGQQAADELKGLLDDPAIGQSLIDAEADALETRAKAAEEKKDYAQALRLYEQYVQQLPKATRFEKVKAHVETLKSDRAIQAAVRSGQASKECKRWLALADNFAASGRADKAREYLQRIIDEYADTEWAAKARARLAKAPSP